MKKLTFISGITGGFLLVLHAYQRAWLPKAYRDANDMKKQIRSCQISIRSLKSAVIQLKRTAARCRDTHFTIMWREYQHVITHQLTAIKSTLQEIRSQK